MALLVPDDLWQAIEPLLAPRRAKPKGGRPRAPDCSALAGILFVLHTGIQWHEVPAELGCCGKTCWRRLARVKAALDLLRTSEDIALKAPEIMHQLYQEGVAFGILS